MRSFISRAALLVKVTARIWLGKALPVARYVRDAGGEHAGLAGAGAGEDEDRTVHGFDGEALFGVQAFEIGRVRLGPMTGGHGARGNAGRLARRRRIEEGQIVKRVGHDAQCSDSGAKAKQNENRR